MNRDYLAIQLDDMWWATVVTVLLCSVQVVLTEAARPCFTSHEWGQADQMSWAVGRVAAAQGSSKGAARPYEADRLAAAQNFGMSKGAVRRGLP
jgi:hypothetical protein